MPRKKGQKQIKQYFSTDPDGNVSEEDDTDSVIDPNWNPDTHEVLDVLDDDADDDNDGNVSPQLPPSKKYKEREDTRAQRRGKLSRRKESLDEQTRKVNKVVLSVLDDQHMQSTSKQSSESLIGDLPMGSVSDDSQMPTRLPLKRKGSTLSNRRRTSFIWNHVTENKRGKESTKISCNHCSKSWTEEAQRGSTSNIATHMKNAHFAKLSDTDKASMTVMGTTSGIKDGKNVPKRCLLKFFLEEAPCLPRGHKSVKECDRLLAKFLINSSTSMHVLEDPDFANFVQKLKEQYTLPSRSYVNDNVIVPMFHETNEAIKNILSKCSNIGLTADAWSSINHTSYITITAHTIDEDCTLHHFVLDTGEIKVRHTSNNLIIHISKVLKKFNLKGRNTKLNTTVSCMLPDDDDDDGVNFLEDTEEESQQSQSQASQETPFLLQSQSQCESPTHEGHSMSLDFDPDATQLSGEQLSPEVLARLIKDHPEFFKDGVPILPGGLSFTTDNASDITRACKVLGEFNWFGCAGHNLNLVAHAGLKKVHEAATLVKVAKKVVEHIRHSIPASYALKKYQDFLQLPLAKLVQENATRWWSVTMMFETLVTNENAVCITLRANKRMDLQPTADQFEDMRKVIQLLQPFRIAGDALGAENDVTISKVLPVFAFLRTNLKIKHSDRNVVKLMKPVMLEKLNNRYDDNQVLFLKTCSLLDPRYKNEIDETEAPEAYANLLTLVDYVCETTRKQEEPESQQEFPPTQGQAQGEQHSIISDTSNRSMTLDDFLHRDDVRPVSVTQHTLEAIKVEVERYRTSVFLSKEEKNKLNIFKWWKDNSAIYPSMYLAFKATLNIPATSVPSERIFSLAGFILNKRRSQLLATNVNRYIFLNRNRDYIPPNTEVLSKSEVDPNQSIAGTSTDFDDMEDV